MSWGLKSCWPTFGLCGGVWPLCMPFTSIATQSYRVSMRRLCDAIILSRFHAHFGCWFFLSVSVSWTGPFLPRVLNTKSQSQTTIIYIDTYILWETDTKTELVRKAVVMARPLHHPHHHVMIGVTDNKVGGQFGQWKLLRQHRETSRICKYITIIRTLYVKIKGQTTFLMGRLIIPNWF